MQNQAFAKVRTPPKLEVPKSTPESPKSNTSTTTTTTIAKTDLYKEKHPNVQHQKEEKKDKAGKEQHDIMEIPRMKNQFRNWRFRNKLREWNWRLNRSLQSGVQTRRMERREKSWRSNKWRKESKNWRKESKMRCRRVSLCRMSLHW